MQRWQQCGTFRTPAECPLDWDDPTCASVADDLVLWPSCCLPELSILQKDSTSAPPHLLD